MGPSTPTLRQKEKFIRLLRITANVARSAEACGYVRTTFYGMRNPACALFDPEFTQQWDDALEAHTDDLEEEGFRRAFGEQIPIRNKNTGKTIMVKDEHGNMVPLTKKQASDLLLIFMLKGNRKKYIDRTAVEGGEIPLSVISSQVKQTIFQKLFPNVKLPEEKS